MGDDEYGPATAARAKWDFVPEEPSGLALTADDELEVWPTDKGWWFARKKRGGYEGYVPRDYVRVATVMAPVGTLVDAPEASALHARRQKLLRTVGLPTACFPSRRAPQAPRQTA